MRDQLQVTRTHNERHTLSLSLTTNSSWNQCTVINSKDLSSFPLPLGPFMAYETLQKHFTVSSKNV